MPADVMTVTILADGSFKIETDKVSAANHGGCEMLIREIVKVAGGKSERKHRHGRHVAHQHSHAEEQHEH